MSATRPGPLRVFGVAAALAWTGLALLHREAWPSVGVVALGIGALGALLFLYSFIGPLIVTNH